MIVRWKVVKLRIRLGEKRCEVELGKVDQSTFLTLW